MFTRPVESQGVPSPTISPASGSILSSQTITISIDGSAVSAEYSFDNSTWILYTSPFTLSSNTTVYARALDADGNYSNVTSNSYVILPYDAQVEYLQSTSAQYINTGISGGTDNLEITCEFKFTSFVKYGAIYGNYVSDNHNGNRLILAESRGRGCVCCNTICTTTGNNVISISPNTNYKIIVNNSRINLNNTIINISKTKKGTTNNGNIALFNRSITNVNTARNIGAQIKSFSIKNNGLLVLDMIPVRVGTTGYMYDKVSGQLFGNIGTGNFILGNDITN